MGCIGKVRKACIGELPAPRQVDMGCIGKVRKARIGDLLATHQIHAP